MSRAEEVRQFFGKRVRGFISEFEIADSGFLILRVVALLGGYIWSILAQIEPVQRERLHYILLYFFFYCLFLYLLLFFFFSQKKRIYVLSLFLDMSFLYMLISSTGGFNSSYFVGLYLLTVLHSFYYGYAFGAFVATLSALVYLVAGRFQFGMIHWTELSLRIAFLFLIALPVGILSDRLRADKERIETLNRELLQRIEEIKNLQARLIESEKLSALGKMTADVAHEIRNPLSAIGGFAKRLKKALKSDSKEMRYVDIICDEVLRLERTLRDVLTFSREAKYHLRYNEINDVVDKALEFFEEACQERDIVIVRDYDNSLPQVLIDAEQVTQVLHNLIMNSIDAMPEGGTLTLSTRMDTEHSVDYIVIDVIDTGSGIPEDKIDRIFEPFFTTKEIGHGTGLGLSICKKIMEEHRGRIKVCSISGTGTSFSLYFPYVAPEDAFKTQCWEYMKCGIERADDAIHRGCPAYPIYGRVCWVVAGTYCEGRVKGAIAQKIGDCSKCEFYQRLVIRKDL